MSKLLKFITWPTIAGLLAAIIILDRLDLMQGSPVAGGKQPASYATAVNRATPSVVNIYTTKILTERRVPLLNDPVLRRLVPSQSRERQRVEQSLGSGVIMSETGYILTNEHVISGAEQILVLLHDGRETMAQVVGSDRDTDLAVLKIDLPNVQPIALADSGQARVGDVVLAIGNPLGFGHSVSQGIISALSRYGLDSTRYEDYIQTDTTVNPGNSGGALIDTEGRLLGINSLIFSPTGTSIGISLAIPTSLARFVMDDLIEYGRVIRGWLGVSVQALRAIDGSARQYLSVGAIAPGSPAERAGIQAGDIITGINGEPVVNVAQTMHEIALLRPGDMLTVELDRRGETVQADAVVGTRPESGG